ncbi:hypothetical protein EV421DRAFT_2063854 [Armillaria borealis]|uniref:Histone deacetylase domain-containing protein n=1 Tax=Armillaria borealis TaxID=47425 RepID=A0AA39MFP5_9AGAR|nr:hypothetical protein EV421DRAFT_2063854 [Armillaria borealis]
MSSFYTDEYVHFLNRVTPGTSEELTYHGTHCICIAATDSPVVLVGEDNPPFEGVFEFCSISAGGSMAAARRIASGASDICINRAGGLHHAKKREASGFCYINDIVFGILELLHAYPRVLYVDTVGIATSSLCRKIPEHSAYSFCHDTWIFLGTLVEYSRYIL